LSGGIVSVVGGLQVKVSAGLGLMPDGQLVSWPDTNLTLNAADSGNPRYDRVELTYQLQNNTQVLDDNGQTKVLDILYAPVFSLNQGSPNASPVVPSLTAGRLSFGFILLPANAIAVLPANITQDPSNGFDVSAIALGDKTAFIRYNKLTESLEFSNDNIRWQAFGSGAGGGAGGASWQPVGGQAPVESYELDEKVLLFAPGQSQEASLWLKIPQGYVPGAQIRLRLGHYSPSASFVWKFQAVASLVRKGADAISSTANQHTSTNGDQSNVGANVYQDVLYDLTSLTGQVNSVSVQPGDILKVQLQRVAPTGTDDSNDVRMIPSTTEVLFS
jgi:hypothetical protein